MCNQQTISTPTKNSRSVQNLKEKAIINIIADSIVFTRFYHGMAYILNASAPKNDVQFNSVDYNGIDTAFTFMDIVDQDLADILSDIYNDNVRGGNQDESADELAQYIYHIWLNEIKNFFLIGNTYSYERTN